MFKLKVRAQVIAAVMALAMILSISVAQAADTAKNVILMISDGWGYNQIRATDYYNGTTASYENPANDFVSYAMSTYSMGSKSAARTTPVGYDSSKAWTDFSYLTSTATDSASAATAMATGIKNYDNQINWYINQTPMTGKTITEVADTKNKSSGVVTSVEWTHATPAAFYAHNTSRNNYAQIANEMLGNDGTQSPLSVIMGAGNPNYDNNGNYLFNPTDYNYVGGKQTWTDLNAGNVNNFTSIQSKTAFQALATTSTPPAKVVGTAEVYSTLQQARDLKPAETTPYEAPQNQYVPDLATMSQGALNVLSQDTDGFFLMIEGGAVDWANHANQLGRMIEEMNDFNTAVDAVIQWIETKGGGWDNNLLIVTGDHECGLLLGPQADLNNPVWNQVEDNGAGVLPDAQYMAGGHSNSLIPLFAKGAGSELFAMYADEYDQGLIDYQGLASGWYIDNTEIFKVMNGQICPAPIPGSLLLMGSGMLGVFLIGLRRRFV